MKNKIIAFSYGVICLLIGSGSAWSQPKSNTSRENITSLDTTSMAEMWRWRGGKNQILTPLPDGYYTLTDSLGNTLTHTKFREIYGGFSHSGCYLIKTDSLYRFLDIANDRVLKPTELARIGNLFANGGLLPIRLNGPKWGYLDSIGRMAIPPQWDNAGYFDNGIARVINGVQPPEMATLFYPTPGQAGYIDARGQYVIPMKYSFIDNFGPASVARFNRGVYNHKTENSSNPRDKYNPYAGYKYGLIARDGTIILPDDTYDYISSPRPDEHRNFIFLVEKGRKTGLIDSTGKVISPLRRKFKT